MKANKSSLRILFYSHDLEYNDAYENVEALLDEIYPTYDLAHDKDFLDLCEDINKRVPLKTANKEEVVYYYTTIYKGKFMWAHSLILLGIKLNHEKTLIDRELGHFVATIKANWWSYTFNSPTVFKYAKPRDENDEYDVVDVYDNGLMIYDKKDHKLREYISAPNGLCVAYTPELYKQKG